DPPCPEHAREIYVRAFRDQPGALHAALNYYRAAFQRPLAFLPARPIDVPVLVIGGERDRYFEPSLLEPPARAVARAEALVLPGTHWIHFERPEAVTTSLAAFLA